jgi:dephospho-CoA kinase
LSEIAQHFGDNFLLTNGELDRAALRAVIFADAEEKAWLERLLHPLIRDWIMGQLQSAKRSLRYLGIPTIV